MPPANLRIAVWHNLPAGGARRSLAAHVKGLNKRGHHIEIWSPPIGDHKLQMVFEEGIEQHVVPLAPHPLNQATYVSRIRRYLTEQMQAVGAMESHSREAAAEMTAKGFDVLLATNCRLFHSPFIGRYVSGPKALYLQDPKRILYEAGDRLIWRAPTPLPPGSSLRSKLSARFRDYVTIRDARRLAELDYWNTAAFDRLLVNSNFSRESMLRAYGLDSRVCYLGIDTDLFTVQGAPKEAYVIGVGSITANKNIEFLIRAVSTIRVHRPRLVWVGQFASPEYSAAVNDLARKSRVELELRVEASDQELVELLGRATAFVYAPRLEPFGFAPLEANACGTVAIGVPEGGLRESIADGVNGFLVDPDPQTFGEKIAWLLSKPELAKSMGLQAAEHVRSNWTWEKSVDVLEGELLALANR